MSLCVECVDEQLADRLALGLGVVDAFQRLNERFGRVDVNERNVEMATKQTHDFVRFALTHEAVIDEHAGELVADRLVDEHGRDREFDSARQTADDARLADFSADAGDLLVAEGGHRPVAFDAGDLEKKVGEELWRRPPYGPPPDGTWSCSSGAPRPPRRRKAHSPTRHRRGSPQAGASRDRHGSSTRDSGRPFAKRRRTGRTFSRISTSARPNSAAWPPSTLPPSCSHKVCWP